jgi:hypothetical protein
MSEGKTMTSDRREHPRTHVLRRARIVFRRGYSTVDCVVLDLSEGGARIRIGNWLALPPTFELRMENGAPRDAEVRFRTRETLGVRFTDGIAA